VTISTQNYLSVLFERMGRNSIVGVVTRWAIRRSNPSESAFSAPVQNGPGSFQPPYIEYRVIHWSKAVETWR